MSRENVEVVRQAFEYFAATGEPLWEVTNSDIEIHDHDAVHGLRVYRGREGFTRFIADNADVFDDFRAQPEGFVDAGEHVVVRVRLSGTGEASGAATSRTVFHVLTLHGGKIICFRAYSTEPEALEAVGRRE